MLTITLMLLVCQQLSTAWTTRLPLEVYELTPVGSAAATTTHDLHYLQHQQQQQQTHQQPYQQHKNLEYATVNAKQQQQQQNASLTTLATETARTTTTTTISSTHVDDATDSHPLDRRRPKQMLEIQQQEQHHQFQQQHRFDHSAMQHHLHRSHQQQQQQQQKNSKDVRILYQVGDSEDDLPICAPNAVCSKIDLYETPWIERQCRCPDANRMPNVIIHHHNSNNNNNKESLDTNSYTHIPTDKFRNYYEKEKFLQHRRILVSADFADKRFESLHLRKLMQKLGAVYQDDLDLQPADFLETNEDGLRDLDVDTVEDEISENEFPPHVARRNPYKATKHSVVLLTPPTLSTAHMRHSGHGNRAKELSFIGGCPSGLGIDDGHTIADKTRHYKMCSPVHKLPVCKHFRDYTWTLTTSAELNVTEQIVHCRCPKNSVTYLTKREAAADGSGGFAYLFACSPLTRIRCQRKQPCKLFTVRKRQEFLDEVNINALCQCPKGHHCPGHHTQSGVIPGESFLEDNIQTYSGYCMAND